jgi:hypothetical protein
MGFAAVRITREASLKVNDIEWQQTSEFEKPKVAQVNNSFQMTQRGIWLRHVYCAGLWRVGDRQVGVGRSGPGLAKHSKAVAVRESKGKQNNTGPKQA